jgi:hypothetical protein
VLGPGIIRGPPSPFSILPVRFSKEASMRWRLGGLLLPAALGFAATPVPPSTTFADQLVGTWRLVSYQRQEAAEAGWKDRLGSSPRGYILYDRTGHMAVQLAKMPRPRFASGKDEEPTPEEARDAYLGYVAYFGTYSVDETRRIVTHHVEGSLRPEYVGTDQERPATLEGDRLTLSDGNLPRGLGARPLASSHRGLDAGRLCRGGPCGRPRAGTSPAPTSEAAIGTPATRRWTLLVS